MVTSRRGKSSNEVVSSSEHELENSPQIETQHGTHRGAEGEFGRDDSEMEMQHAHVGHESQYMQPNTSGIERFLTPSVHENRSPTPQARRSRQSHSLNASGSDDDDESDTEIDVDAMMKMFTKLFRLKNKPKRNLRGATTEEDRALIHSPRKVAISASDLMYANMALSGIKLPKLDNKLFLENHLDRVNSILEEMDLLSEGQFERKFKHRLMAIVSESLSGVSEVSKSFEDLEKFGHDWESIRKSLLAQFCSRASLSFTLKEKLSALKFSKPYTKFINDIKEIYYLHKRFYSDKGEAGSLVRKVIEVLPNFISRPIVKELVLTNEDWEHAVGFEQFLKKVESHLVVAETCDSIIQTGKTIDKRADRTFRARSIERINGKSWLDEWSDRFKSVWYLKSPNLDAVREVLNKAVEYKTMNGRVPGGEYYFVGFHSVEDAKKALSIVDEKSYRPYSPSKPKN